MHYKIVFDSGAPCDREVYTGFVAPREDEHPIISALALECGDLEAGPDAVSRLEGWSGGEIHNWIEEVPPGDERTEFVIDGPGCGITIRVSDTRF